MRRINFFALKSDIASALASMEQARTIKYARADYSSAPMIHELTCWDHLPNLGVATADQEINCDTFLVAEKTEVIHAREFRLNNGRLQYSVDQLMNQGTIFFRPGGVWRDGSIISGCFATTSDDKLSLDLMRTAASAIRKSFVRVKAFWVGPEAIEAFRSGARLTTAIQSPLEYDLRE